MRPEKSVGNPRRSAPPSADGENGLGEFTRDGDQDDFRTPIECGAGGRKTDHGDTSGREFGDHVPVISGQGRGTASHAVTGLGRRADRGLPMLGRSARRARTPLSGKGSSRRPRGRSRHAHGQGGVLPPPLPKAAAAALPPCGTPAPGGAATLAASPTVLGGSRSTAQTYDRSADVAAEPRAPERTSGIFTRWWHRSATDGLRNGPADGASGLARPPRRPAGKLRQPGDPDPYRTGRPGGTYRTGPSGVPYGTPRPDGSSGPGGVAFGRELSGRRQGIRRCP